MPPAIDEPPGHVIDVDMQVHPAQDAFTEDASPIRGFVGGRGAGKSWVGALDIILRAKPDRLYMVAAPTYPMLKDATLRTFLTMARSLGVLGDFARGTMTAMLHNGAEILFRSADDPERLRGPNLSGVWLDEASLMDRDAYDIVLASLREQGERGWLSCTFTPKGRLHWTYEVFVAGSDGKGPAPGVRLFHARTRDNPFTPPGFHQDIAHQYSGLRAQQELGGEFITIEGAEWPPEYFPDSMWFDDWPSDIVIRSIGIDPSKGKDAKSGDYCAIAMLGRCREGKLWCEADLFRRPAEFIVQQAAEWQDRFKADVVAVESNQFQELLATQIGAEIRKRGVGMPLSLVVNQVNKQVRIRRLGPHLSRKTFRFRDTPGTRLLVEQLRNFPECDHDDGPDALEMALRSMIEIWNSKHGR